MQEFFDPIEALELIKSGKKIALRDWPEGSYVCMVDGKIFDDEGDQCGVHIGSEDFITKPWMIYKHGDIKVAWGVVDLMESLEKGIWRYATVVGNDAWGPDDKIVLKGDTLEWESGGVIPVYKSMLESKFYLHK